MIKRLDTPQLSSMKTRCGLQSISELIPRLIRQYELQAELVQRREAAQRREGAVRRRAVSVAPTAPVMAMSVPAQQATFGWYE